MDIDWDKIDQAIAKHPRGSLIPGIKEYRLQTNSSLMEAKQAIEGRYEQRYGRSRSIERDFIPRAEAERMAREAVEDFRARAMDAVEEPSDYFREIIAALPATEEKE